MKKMLPPLLPPMLPLLFTLNANAQSGYAISNFHHTFPSATKHIEIKCCHAGDKHILREGSIMDKPENNL